MTIKRVDRARSHHYVDTDTDQRVPGVTTILDQGIPKPALINWAASATAEYAVDNWEDLTHLGPSERLKQLNRSRYAAKDAAANKGTKVHELAERLVHGDVVTVPEDIAGHVAAYVRFLDDFDVQPVLVESVVWSREHNYCGTLDLVAELDPTGNGDRQRWLLDIKTGRSGIFRETALQLAAYRWAEVWIDDTLDARPMPDVELCGAIHVRSDGYSLHPVEAEAEQFRQFLYVQQVAAFMGSDLVGDPIEPPTHSAYTLHRVAS